MPKTKPIKEKEVIKRIKEYYSSKGNVRDLLMFELGINTGLKVVNILNLNIKDVLGKESIKIKSGTKYEIKEEVSKLIKEVAGSRKQCTPLFVTNRGARVGRQAAYHNFKTVCDELSLPDISMESWRKTFGYHYYSKYKDLTFLQWYFGHQSVIQTMRYIDIQEPISSRYQDGIDL